MKRTEIKGMKLKPDVWRSRSKTKEDRNCFKITATRRKLAKDTDRSHSSQMEMAEAASGELERHVSRKGWTNEGI